MQASQRSSNRSRFSERPKVTEGNAVMLKVDPWVTDTCAQAYLHPHVYTHTHIHTYLYKHIHRHHHIDTYANTQNTKGIK